MWDAIKDAIQTNGRTLRFIAIIAALAFAAWLAPLPLPLH
jgi:predicted negative regulator of RcsB-dependent stress response